MGRIQVLDEQLSNMIAAGEVVERPASVVKELIENAIDAGAGRIEVHVEEGGLQLIRIVDDGHGMDREDCQKAFERHATSKIRTTRDLFRIGTLGFRGEALPSIASVSRMELVSSESSGQVGTRVIIEGGQIKSITDAAVVKGTEICVRDLFYNTPARLKYMKSIATEIGHISDYVNRLALTYPSVAFTFTHNGKLLLQTSGDGKLLHVMAAIYGVQVAKLLLPISGETLDFRWNGFLSKTEVTRANRSYLTTLVNGRYVRSFSLNNAIMRGYHTLLPVGRYPIVALHIEMEPTLVDVNVHPAKLEVRFSKEDELCSAIEESVRSTLRQGLTVIQPMQAERKAKIVTQVEQPQFDLPTARLKTSYPLTQPSETVQREWRETARPQWKASDPDPSKAEQGLPSSPALPVVREEPEGYREREPAAMEQKNAAERLFPDETEISSSSQHEPATALEPSVPVLYPVGQVHGTYIVAQNDDGMYLIDQHAAQERIFYEHFMRKLGEESTASQLMLFPHTIECTSAEEARLEKKLPLLRSMGLDVESFGNRTFIVRAHPDWFPEGSELEVIEELIQFVLETGENSQADVTRMREKAAIMMACKASIKANRFLTHAEMEALLNRLRETSSPFTCPHGRPIVIHFSTYDLEKMFKRVM